MSASRIEKPNPFWLPAGLYIRSGQDCDLRNSPEVRKGSRQVQQWRVTGESSSFWWELVITKKGEDSVEFRCTKCGSIDYAFSVDDVLSLIRAGAHLHDTDPADRHAPGH